MEKKTIGAFIAVLRKANGMTQKELAEKLNVSDKTVSRWERDECAPDLSLIPIIADLFHVTTDELLRGERRAETAEPPKNESRSEKQMSHLLTSSRTAYLTRSILSGALAVMGVLASMICNFAFTRAYLGFYIGCLFFLGAIVCQTVFTIRAFSAVSTGEFDSEKMMRHREELVKVLLWTASWIVVLFAFTLPLVIRIWDAYMGLEMESWAPYGLLYAAIGAIGCALVWWIVSSRLCKKGILPHSAGIKKRTALLLKTIVVVLVILFVILSVQGNLNSYLWMHKTLYEGTAYESFDAFKEAIETEVEDSYPMASDVGILHLYEEPVSTMDAEELENCYVLLEDGSIHGYYSAEELSLMSDWEGYLGTFRHLNRQIQWIDVLDGVITTFDTDQVREGRYKEEMLNIGFLVLDILVIAGGLIFYLRKRKKV